MVNIVNYKKEFDDERLIQKIVDFISLTLDEYKASDKVLTIVFCGNQFIEDLNFKYRGKPGPTDVLSFCYDDEDDPPRDLNTGAQKELGDVIISIDKAYSQAKEYDIPFENELGRLAIHGTLHLLGFDHETSKTDAKIMFEKQDKLLDDFIKTLCED